MRCRPSWIAITICTILQGQTGSIVFHQPKVLFDENQAKIQMEQGSSCIRGKVYVRDKVALVEAFNMSKKHPAYKGTSVSIYPYCGYLAEWLDMAKKQKGGTRFEKVGISNIANGYRMVTRVLDDEGNFEAKGLKPGKYLIVAEVTYGGGGNTFVQTGEGSISNARTGQTVGHIQTGYQDFVFFDISKLAMGLATISSENQVIEVTVRGQ